MVFAKVGAAIGSMVTNRYGHGLGLGVHSDAAHAAKQFLRLFAVRSSLR
jgi:hypothetical protein